MRWLELARRAVTYGVAGALAGGLAGVATMSVAASAVAQGTHAPRSVLDVTHSPALLRLSRDAAQLVYEAHCAPAGAEDPEAGCDLTGSVFARLHGARSFRELPLERPAGGGARLVASIPDELWSAGTFEYFAVVRSADASVTVPSGGADAPTTSRRIDGAVSVPLGRHRFGAARAVGERVASARWGSGPFDVGLERGPTSHPIGASSFDVEPAGAIVLLDHARSRLLRWSRGAGRPERIPISVNGTIADLAAAADGSIFVLETTSRDERNPLVRRFDEAGRELEAIATAEPGPAQIRMGPDGPLVLQRPSHQWMPALIAGVPASPAAQRSRGRDARRLPSGAEVVVLRTGNEIRVALLTGGAITRSWRLTSDTSLGEVQLAEPLGARFVVVLRVYDDTISEFAVLSLDGRGLRERTTVSAAGWAEGAPLGRFRLAGTGLYRLGTSQTGVFVDRFDLEVHR